MSDQTTPTKSFLSASQKRIVGAGATALAAVILIAAAFLLFTVLRSFVTIFSGVLLPLTIAAILATLLRPIVTFCESRTRMSRVQAIVVLYILVVLVLAVGSVFTIPVILNQAGLFIEHGGKLFENVLGFAQQKLPSVWEWLHNRLGQAPDQYAKNLLAEHSEILKNTIARILSSAGSVAGFFGGLFGTIAAYAIIPVYLFFILNGNRDVWKDIQKQLDFLPEERRDDLVFLVRQFSEILISFFRGQIIIGLLLGVVLAIGFFFVGLKFGIIIGIILGLLNIIPYLGTVLGIITVTPLAYFQEGGGSTLILLCGIVFIIGQLLTDYVFTPRIMGDKTGMGPMLIIFSVFFWGTALGGILGMVLAIPLTAFFLVFWRLAREKYLPALTAKHSPSEDIANA